MLGLGAAGVVAGGAFLLFKRKRAANRQQAAPAIPAHELAYRQIQEILDEKLIERGDSKLFFSRISDVLRGYIENRFGLQAPRRTTEEFLSDISRDAPFSAEHKGLLTAFLRDCDLVKFAEHTPSQEEITQGHRLLQGFHRRHEGRRWRVIRRRRHGDTESRRCDLNFPWAFLILPLFLLLVWSFLRRPRGVGLRFSSVRIAASSGASWKTRLRYLPLVVRGLAVVLLTIGLARPQQGREEVRDVSQGIAMEMVVDRSGSMATGVHL